MFGQRNDTLPTSRYRSLVANPSRKTTLALCLKPLPALLAGILLSSLSGCSLPGKKRETIQSVKQANPIRVKQDLIAKNTVQGLPASHADAPRPAESQESDEVTLVSHITTEAGTSLLSLEQAFPAVATELSLSEPNALQQPPEEVSLEELLRLAELNNPTLRQANAAICEAQAIRTQVGLRPNPSVGYQAVQVADLGTDQHTIFYERDFVTANKLACNQHVASKAVLVQVLELETQRQRVKTDVSVKFMEALAAQRRIELISDFIDVADAGLKLAELRKNALEGTQVEVLQAEIQKNEVELELTQANVKFESLIRELSALCGVQLSKQKLVGSLPESASELVWSDVAASIVARTPEHQVALSQVEHAKAKLRRSSVQSVPNVTFQIGTGFDNGTDNGMLNLELASPIPTNNKNQGNIAAARASLSSAHAELRRVRDSINSRVASVSKDYDSSLAAVRRYSDMILPKSKASLDLAEQAYRIGESSFLVVLTARRTYFEANLQFLEAQKGLARSQAMLDGLVLTGGLARASKLKLDSSLRERTFFQQ